LDSNGRGSSIGSQVGDAGVGNSGGIRIDTAALRLENGAIIDTSTFGKGNAGPIQINAKDSIYLVGASLAGARSGIGSQIGHSGIGNSGEIVANTSALRIEDGGYIDTSTHGLGNAGAIKIKAIDVVIASKDLFLPGGIASLVAASGVGNGGGIDIDAYNMRLSNGGYISSSAYGGNIGQAGSINIALRDRLQLDNQSSINASTARSSSKVAGANISISLGGDMLLNNGSSITASATGKANGGNIKLLLANGFLLSSFPGSFDGNDILASAEEGDGGRIEFRALGIFGININTFLTPISEASAKSGSGRDGVLAVYIPYLTPDWGVVRIEQPLDPDNDLVRACSPRSDGRGAEFTQTGRGGLPSLPGDRPTASPLLDDLGRPALRQGSQARSTKPSAFPLNASPPSSFQPAPSATTPIASAAQRLGAAPSLLLPQPPCPEPR
jgi:large exoprotein involved in heme utilization and adhesion